MAIKVQPITRKFRIGMQLIDDPCPGNSASHGQFVLGQPRNTNGLPASRERAKRADRLPTIAELFPEVIDTATPEDTLPYCSAVEALQRQEPFINQNLAMQALAMLTQLFRYGSVDYHGGFYNAKTGTLSPIAVPDYAKTAEAA